MPCPSPKSPPFPLAFIMFVAALTTTLLPMAAKAEAETDSPLRPGAWALEFEIKPTSLFDFGTSTGSTIAIKRHRSERFALRFGLSAAFDESKGEGERMAERFDITSNPTYLTRQGVTNNHYESHSYALFLHLQGHRPVRDAVSVFWECGPSFRYTESEFTDEDLYPYLSAIYPQETYRSDGSSASRSVALDLNLGFEWFFKRRLSLGARVGAWGGYSWGSGSTTDETVTSDDSWYYRSTRRSEVRTFRFRTSSTTVALSAYL